MRKHQQVFRMSVQTARNSNCILGKFYRRIRSNKGPGQATVATAPKLACLVYHLLKSEENFKLKDVEECCKQIEKRRLRNLTKRAKKLDYELTPIVNNKYLQLFNYKRVTFSHHWNPVNPPMKITEFSSDLALSKLEEH
ncbi:hypothetical protein OAM01_02815 [bacterium]|nr:hypothetical protein [bacterium]